MAPCVVELPWVTGTPVWFPPTSPGSGLTWKCYYCEQVLSVGSLSHQGRGDNGGLDPRAYYYHKDD